MSDTSDSRRQALQVLQRVIRQGESLSTALPERQQDLPAQDRAFVQMLVYGVCRTYWRLDALLKHLLQKPLKQKDTDIRLVLLLALYELLETRVPDHAAVDGAVKRVPKKKAWARGLVNGVLRHFIRHREQLLAELDADEPGRYAHPAWMIDRLRRDWPDAWQAILEAGNRQAPMVLRINPRIMSVTDYRERLQQPARPVACGLQLEQPGEATSLPGYAEGAFSVQDAGAQQAAPLMDLQPGQRVLDACAAPGGKTGHMLELQPALELLALDVAEDRLDRVRENLQRLGLSATLRCADVARPDDWWDGRPFDRILLDVPCSASGVIRRHPDIKLLRREDDIARLAQTQQHILRQTWGLLAPGGRLLYATCSVFKQENEAQVAAFLADTTDAREIVIDASWGRQCLHGRQILPGEDDMDGFYYALLEKV